MTFDQLLAIAHELRDTDLVHQNAYAAKSFAAAVLDLLGEAQPCAMPEPEIVEPPGDGTDGVVVITTETPGVYVAAEARAYAVLLLRAADRVDVGATR